MTTPSTRRAPATAVRRAWVRLGMHLASAVIVQTAMIIHVTQSEELRDSWWGSVLSTSVIFYAGLGVAILKEGIPALRHEKGDIRNEPRILRAAFGGACRDGVIAAISTGLVLLLIPHSFDASLVLFGLAAATFVDICIRQYAIRRRLPSQGDGQQDHASIR